MLIVAGAIFGSVKPSLATLIGIIAAAVPDSASVAGTGNITPETGCRPDCNSLAVMIPGVGGLSVCGSTRVTVALAARLNVALVILMPRIPKSPPAVYDVSSGFDGGVTEAPTLT